MLKHTTALLYLQILVNILKSAEGTANVYAKVTSEGMVDFRSIGIGQPNELLGTRRRLRQSCCQGYRPIGSRGSPRTFIALNHSNIKNVDFSYNSIKFLNDTSFNGWKSIELIRLDYNQITEISVNAFSQVCLKILDLSYNYLSGIDWSSLPQVMRLDISNNLFNNLSNIKMDYSEEIHLENNKITAFTIDQILNRRRRSKLFMDNNLIEVLEGHISELHLQRLSISHNMIHKVSNGFFLEAFSLISINLSYNYLTVLADRMFSNLNGLETLDLSGNKITQINVDSMRRMLGLKQVFMAENLISIVPRNFLRDSTSLQRMELSGTIESFQFFDRFPNIEDLRWSGADLETMKAICKFTVNFNHLELYNVMIPDIVGLTNTCNISKLNTLVMSFVKLHAIPLSMMRSSRNLKYLSLANNNLVSVNIAVLPSTLVVANLSSNFIKELLSLPINNLPELRIIDLQHNLLKSVPLYISQTGTQLDFTNLMNNNITSTSRQVLMQSVNTRYLCFYDNCVHRDIKFSYYGQSEFPKENILGCQCHRSIRDVNGFSTVRMNIDPENFISYLFKNYISGCIKHASIYNGSNLSDLSIFSSLASELSSLYLHEWNLSYVQYFHLDCSPQLQRLSIVKSGLKHINQSAFSSLAHLQMLDLSENELTEFEFDCLQYMPKVRDLNLSHNLITQIEISEDTPFRNILQLKILDLSHNKLTAVEFGQFYILVNLDTLYLSYNEISSVTLSCALSESRQIGCENFPLKTLSLSNNQIQDWLLTGTWILKNFVELDLSSNGMCRFEGENFDSICFLNLSRNCISHFRQKGCLRGGFILDISGNEILQLSNVQLKYSPSILKASWNFIDNIKRADMEDKLTLAELYLSHNFIGKLESGCFNRMIVLKTLDLSYNELKNFQARNLFVMKNIGYHWNQHILNEINLFGNPELHIVSLAVNNSALQIQKLLISKLCIIETHNCHLSGEDVKRYLQLPEKQRNDYLRTRQLIDIYNPNFSCSPEGAPVILLTCFLQQ